MRGSTTNEFKSYAIPKRDLGERSFDGDCQRLAWSTETVTTSLWRCLIVERLDHTCVPAFPFDVVGPRCATRVSALTSRKRLTLAPVRRDARWGMQRGDDRLPLPSPFSLPIRDHPRHPHGERHTQLPRFHRIPPRSPLCTHRPRDHPLHVGARVE